MKSPKVEPSSTSQHDSDHSGMKETTKGELSESDKSHKSPSCRSLSATSLELSPASTSQLGSPGKTAVDALQARSLQLKESSPPNVTVQPSLPAHPASHMLPFLYPQSPFGQFPGPQPGGPFNGGPPMPPGDFLSQLYSPMGRDFFMNAQLALAARHPGFFNNFSSATTPLGFPSPFGQPRFSPYGLAPPTSSNGISTAAPAPTVVTTSNSQTKSHVSPVVSASQTHHSNALDVSNLIGKKD